MTRALLASIAALCTFAACGDSGPVDTGDNVPATVSLSSAAVTASSLGDTVRLVATVRNASGEVIANADVVWTTDRADVATVDASGLVTAVATGAASVSAVAGSAEAVASVSVMQVVDAILIAPRSLSLDLPDGAAPLSATVIDARGSTVDGASVDWISRDPLVATVSTAGSVSAQTAGTTWVVASSNSVSDSVPVTVGTGGPPMDTSDPVALTAMANLTYLGFEGGLYPDGSNVLPAAHLQAGLTASAAIERLDVAGQPDPDGSYVLLSIGMSNTTEEFCSESSTYPCDGGSFVGQALADPDVADEGLVFVNGASPGAVSGAWSSPTAPSYNRVLTEDLQPAGLSELQVQAVWLKVANPVPSVSLPDADADAIWLQRSQGDVLRALRIRYPNLQMVFLSSRIYAGYATVDLNPEPYAYESGFSAKWTIEAQIQQEATGVVNPNSGDLEIGVAAPWVGWGPYIWADGPNPNPDGLAWLLGDFDSDGTHPSPSGAQKVGAALLDFFKTSPVTVGWFLR